MWSAIGYLELALFRSLDQAASRLLHSLHLYPHSSKTRGLLGDLYFQKAVVAGDAADRRRFLSLAPTNYDEAFKLTTAGSPETYLYAAALGKVHWQLLDWTKAISAYEKALSVCSPQERWINEETLGRLYAEIKDRTNSVAHFQRAIELAPADRRPGIKKLWQQVLATP